jgi:general secretion pathway protein J
MKARHPRGFTLFELLIAITILAMISMLLYSAFAGMKSTREGLNRIGDRYREGRLAMNRITRDLSSAYLSSHAPFDQSLIVLKTSFIGHGETPADRVDFNTFSHTRLDRDAHESDQAEVSYFGVTDPEDPDVIDLVRRVSSHPDVDPEKGGRIEVIATNIDLFELEYLDPLSNQWVETWDTTQAIGQPNRLPSQVRVILVLKEGERASSSGGRSALRLSTKITLPIQQPLAFATQ